MKLILPIPMEIRQMKLEDWSLVAQIYEEGIATGIATLETTVPTYEAWNASHLPHCRFVAIKNDELLGWVALSPVSGRCVYGGVAEVSIYIGKKSRGMGIGQKLFQHLIEQSEKEGIWTLQSGIFPENVPSINLHKRMGFRFIGTRERVAKLHDQWKDNYLFERRSSVVGVD